MIIACVNLQGTFIIRYDSDDFPSIKASVIFHASFYKMDPGQKYVQNLKSVPNLVSEEPSIITPTNTSFVDVPWSDFAKLLAQKRKTTAEKCQNNPLPQFEDYSPTQPEKSSIEDFRIGNWDAATGYQDKEHNIE